MPVRLPRSFALFACIAMLEGGCASVASKTEATERPGAVPEASPVNGQGEVESAIETPAQAPSSVTGPGVAAVAVPESPPIASRVVWVAPRADPAPMTTDGVPHPSVSSLAAAVALVEAARAAGSTEPWTIRLAPGVHEVRRGVVLGAAIGPLSIEATAPGATLVGAMTVAPESWRVPDEALLARVPHEARAHVLVAELDADDLRTWSGGLSGPVHSGHAVPVTAVRSELFAGEVALEPARWPNEGFAAIGELVDRGSVPRAAESDMPAAERRIEAPRAGAFAPADRERAARWAGAETAGERDAWAHGYWNWDWSDEVLPIASIDAASGVVRLGMPHRYGLAARGRFRVINILAELDAPGEYWIDRTGGRIVAWIPDALREALRSLSLLAEPLMRVDGARDVRIAGIAFERTRGGAIEARGVERLAIEECRFQNLGTFAVDAEGVAIRAARCLFKDVGGRGVRLVGGDRKMLVASGSAIEDCVFVGCGRVLRSYNPAIDLEGVGHRVVRNEISQHPHIAVFLRGNDHVIEANDIHHVVLETGDAGAVYCGRDWTSHGNVIRGNLFSAIEGSDARFQNAVYLDDMASGFLVEGNLFVDCNWGILAGGGRDNMIRANIFAGCRRAISYDARGIGWMAPHIADPESSTLHRNLAAMPIGDEPWRSRFPALATYLTDRFGRPVGSAIVGNVLVATPLGRIDDTECVRIEGTRRHEVDEARVPALCDELARQARDGVAECDGVRVGPVGPR